MTDSITLQQQQFRRMTETPVPRLVASLALPSILTMLIGAFYNLADTLFVARLGTSAAGAVGIVFALMSVFQSIAFMVGIGSGSFVSRALGRQDRAMAERFASSGFALAMFFGALLTVAGTCFTARIVVLLGATATIMPYARDYAVIISAGAIAFCGSIVLNNILRAEGKAVFATVGLGAGGVLNVLLDPLFIFRFGLGISGAAAATLLSQCVSFGVLFYFFRSGRTIVNLSWRSVSRTPADYASVLKLGFSSFCRQGLASMSTVAQNLAAGAYGDSAVAAMSIVGRVFFFILASLIGFGQGFQPVAGYNYGARNYDRVRKAFCFCVKFGTVFLTCAAVTGFLTAPRLIALFREDDVMVMAIGTAALRAQCVSMPLQATIVLSNMLFQSVGKALQATFISATRQGIYFLPLILILPRYFGLRGIEWTQCVSDTLAFASALPLVCRFFSSLGRGSAGNRSGGI